MTMYGSHPVPEINDDQRSESRAQAGVRETGAIATTTVKERSS